MFLRRFLHPAGVPARSAGETLDGFPAKPLRYFLESVKNCTWEKRAAFVIIGREVGSGIIAL
jgi:hypothetical protein